MRPSVGMIYLFPLTLISALPQNTTKSFLPQNSSKIFEALRTSKAPAQPNKASAYKTAIDLRDTIINYGNQNPGDIFESVLRPSCRGNGCVLTPTEVKTYIWHDDHTHTQEQTLKLTTIDDYPADEADTFIDAIVGAACGAAQCEVKTYTVGSVRSSHSLARVDFDGDGWKSYTETFCKMSDYVKIYRNSATGDEDKHGSTEVTIEVEEKESFN